MGSTEVFAMGKRMQTLTQTDLELTPQEGVASIDNSVHFKETP